MKRTLISMKTIGIIGGLSAESTATYYQALNRGVNKRLGGNHSAKILLSSVDFEEFVQLKKIGDWDTQAQMLVREAQRLEQAGAEFIILATNTMHKMADQIESSISVPFLHIAEVTAEKIKEVGLSSVTLLGTKPTMELDFYKDYLKAHGVECLVPDQEMREEVSRIIYEELAVGVCNDNSRRTYLQVIDGLKGKGSQGVIFGCTEIGLLLDPKDIDVPVFDTADIHVEAALNKIFEE